ncbi:peptidyl-prolyl cis-trans isomerase [Streptomyces sp. NPDC001348]
MSGPAHGPGEHLCPPEGAAALVCGETVGKDRVEVLLASVPPRGRDARPESLARAERQRRRWATQVVVVDELARRACAERGSPPPQEVPPARLPAVPESDVADLGSIVATALARSPAARALLAELEAEQEVPEAVVREYYDNNPDRFLTSGALRRGVEPFGGATPEDFLPYERAREGIERELRRAAGRRAFLDWLDLGRSGVVYAEGHEHPGDPTQPDHDHRH